MSELTKEVDHLVELAKRLPKAKPDPRTLNAYRHGLTGHVRFFACPEEEAAFKKHCEGYQAAWATVGPVEIDLCHRLADTSWRLHTVGQMENSIQAEALAHPVVRHCDHQQADIALEYSRIWKDSGNQLDLLSRYERRLQRNYNELMTNLQQVQALRRAAEREKQLANETAAAESNTARTHRRLGLDNLLKMKTKPACPPSAEAELVKFDFSRKSAAPIAPNPHP